MKFIGTLLEVGTHLDGYPHVAVKLTESAAKALAAYLYQAVTVEPMPEPPASRSPLDLDLRGLGIVGAGQLVERTLANLPSGSRTVAITLRNWGVE